MSIWVQMLTKLGWALGALVVLAGLGRYLWTGEISSLLIAVAVLVVGPLEDVLTRWATRLADTPAQKVDYVELVNQGTSAAFLCLLLVAIFID